MAQISFEGFVQDRRGKMLRVSEEYRKRDDQGNWSNDGYGDYTVWLKDDDAQPEVQAGAVVLVSGEVKIRKVEKDGKTYTNVTVGGRSVRVGITRLTNKYQGAAQQAQGAPNTGGTGNYAAPATNGAQAGTQDAWVSPGSFNDSDTPF